MSGMQFVCSDEAAQKQEYKYYFSLLGNDSISILGESQTKSIATYALLTIKSYNRL